MEAYFDAEDEIYTRWLITISPLVRSAFSFSPVLISVQGRVVYVICTHRYMAQQIRQYDDLLKKSKYGVNILVGGKKYAFIPPSRPTIMNNILENTTLENSNWGMLNPLALDMMSDDGTVSIHSTDRDAGYKLLTICPYRKIDTVLCLPDPSLPKEQLVGKSVMDTWNKSMPETEVISATKMKVIEEAIATKKKIIHTYEMNWKGILWKKSITGVVVENEVLCITRNLEDYQRKFWENFVG